MIRDSLDRYSGFSSYVNDGYTANENDGNRTIHIRKKFYKVIEEIWQLTERLFLSLTDVEW